MIMRKHLIGRDGMVYKKKEMKHGHIQTVSGELRGQVSLRPTAIAAVADFVVQRVRGLQVGILARAGEKKKSQRWVLVLRLSSSFEEVLDLSYEYRVDS